MKIQVKNLFFLINLVCIACWLAQAPNKSVYAQLENQDMQELKHLPQPSDEWIPKSSMISTEFSENLDLDNILSEYPRPTMVRPNWLSLNGVWELKPGTSPLHPESKNTAPLPGHKIKKGGVIQTMPEPGITDESIHGNGTLYEDESEGIEIENIAVRDINEPNKNTKDSINDIKSTNSEKNDSINNIDNIDNIDGPVKQDANEPPSEEAPEPSNYLASVVRGQTPTKKTSEEKSTESEYPYRILVPFPLESPLSGVKWNFDRVTYRRFFSIPEDWNPKDRVILHFGAVDWEAAVIVDGKFVGTHQCGFTPFSFDITDYLAKNNENGEHELVVSVYDPTQNGMVGKQSPQPNNTRCTSCSGIWQSVWLEPVPVSSISKYTATPNIDDSTVIIETEVKNPRAEEAVEIEVLSEGESVATSFGGPNGKIIVKIPNEKLKLWSPETPFLYTLRIRLLVANKEVDSVNGYFGMRKVDLAKDKQGKVRIRLNNKFYFQLGILDAGYWPEGVYTAPSDEAVSQDLLMVKDLGYNMIRKHGKIEPERWYYWCDKIGLLVWQDIPAGTNQTSAEKKQFEEELTKVIPAFSNHPSIVMWVLFHEGQGQHKTDHYSLLIRKLDPTRLVNAASGWKDIGVGQVADIHQFPGPVAPKSDPFRAGVIGDFGGYSLIIQDHTASKKPWGYLLSADASDFDRKFRGTMFALEALVKKNQLSAAVYHQYSDVESECNGLISYDRKILKIPAERIRSINKRITTLNEKL
ncbi:MAG: glycoside hydrolase family 2 protein [Thermoguttaceae bacterium]